MKSGYKIQWTDHALSELNHTTTYLQENWKDKELKNFFRELDHTIELISRNPELFQVSKKKSGVRRAIVAKFNNLYYRIEENQVVLLSLFSNRQDPKKNKF